MTPDQQKFKTYLNLLRRTAYRKGLRVVRIRPSNNSYQLYRVETDDQIAWGLSVDDVADRLGVDRYVPQPRPERTEVRLRPAPAAS